MGLGLARRRSVCEQAFGQAQSAIWTVEAIVKTYIFCSAFEASPICCLFWACCYSGSSRTPSMGTLEFSTAVASAQLFGSCLLKNNIRRCSTTCRSARHLQQQRVVPRTLRHCKPPWELGFFNISRVPRRRAHNASFSHEYIRGYSIPYTLWSDSSNATVSILRDLKCKCLQHQALLCSTQAGCRPNRTKPRETVGSYWLSF